jgi:hypothetical protein
VWKEETGFIGSTSRMASESKKEAFRKYLEASGVLEALTKVLVALYEEHEKPPIALEFVRHALGGPTVAEHDKLKKDLVELQVKYDLLLSQHEECCRQVYSASFQISTIFQNRERISLWRFVIQHALCHSYDREHEDTSS